MHAGENRNSDGVGASPWPVLRREQRREGTAMRWLLFAAAAAAAGCSQVYSNRYFACEGEADFMVNIGGDIKNRTEKLRMVAFQVRTRFGDRKILVQGQSHLAGEFVVCSEANNIVVFASVLLSPAAFRCDSTNVEGGRGAFNTVTQELRLSNNSLFANTHMFSTGVMKCRPAEPSL